MNLLFTITSSLFFLWVGRNTFYWVTVWQQNEYRPDRFFVFFKRKKRKSLLFFSPLILSKWLLFIAYFFFVFHDNYLPVYQYAVFIFYLLLALDTIKALYLNTIKKPKLSILSNSVIILTLFTSFLVFAVPLVDRFFWLIFIDLLIPLLVAFFVFLFSFPAEIITDWQIEHAVSKLKDHPELRIIAVTGSNGKSITKDFIAQVLSQKFAVIKTHGSDNTAYGIARTVNKHLEGNTEIFVAELSAYKRGEIRALCQMIHPQIGVLTAITNHHVSLFKNLENIKKTNRELIEALPKEGFCLFNGTSKNTLGLYKQTRRHKILYTCSDSKSAAGRISNQKQNIIACNIIEKNNKKSFTVNLNDKPVHFVVPSHNSIDHILPAIYLAHFFGMKQTKIKRAVANLK